MIRPSQQWALQIDITNACHLHCSNCTRLLDHAKTRYFMSPACFEQAIRAVRDFATSSEPCPVGSNNEGRRKVIGLIGGEPLLHPQFPEIVDIFVREVPNVVHRGLWTAKHWPTYIHPKWGAAATQVHRLIGLKPTHNAKGPSSRHTSGFLNWNEHLEAMQVRHQPVLVASADLVPDERARWNLIENCWVQQEWSGTCTPKGFFFCEVAAHFDMVMQGPGGLPLEPGVWRGELTFETDGAGVRRPTGKFANQINRWCSRCGACVPQAARRDAENRDDVSPLNLVRLQEVESPRVRRGEIVVHEAPADPDAHRPGWNPKQYTSGQPFAGYGGKPS